MLDAFLEGPPEEEENRKSSFLDVFKQANVGQSVRWLQAVILFEHRPRYVPPQTPPMVALLPPVVPQSLLNGMEKGFRDYDFHLTLFTIIFLIIHIEVWPGRIVNSKVVIIEDVCQVCKAVEARTRDSFPVVEAERVAELKPIAFNANQCCDKLERCASKREANTCEFSTPPIPMRVNAESH